MSFAQEAEDLVLLRTLVLRNSRPGYYVDVGAHDPKWLSNTYLLYLGGWCGLNIDAAEGLASRFAKIRPRDRFIEALVGNEGVSEFVEFDQPAFNGVSSDGLESRVRAGIKVARRRSVPSVPLARLLDEHLPDGQMIDVMSMDVEGHEGSVIDSNDWQKYRPRVLLVEIGDAMLLEDVASSEVAKQLTVLGYRPYAKTGLTVFFADESLLRRTAYGFEVDERAMA